MLARVNNCLHYLPRYTYYLWLSSLLNLVPLATIGTEGT